MWRLIVTGFLCGGFSVLVFHQGTNLLLFRSFGPLQALLDLSPGFRPPSTGYSLRLAPPLGLPELLNLVFWGGCWGVLLAATLRLLRPPLLLTGFLFGALVCTGFGFAPFYGERGLPLWSVIYLPNWFRVALVNGAWGWGTAAMIQASGLTRRFAR
jgi:hypothetical protein